MKFQLLVEHDAQTKSWCATVAGLPIVVDADSEDDAIKMAKEGIEFYFEESNGRHRSSPAAQKGKVKSVTVEI